MYLILESDQQKSIKVKVRITGHSNPYLVSTRIKYLPMTLKPMVPCIVRIETTEYSIYIKNSFKDR